VSERPGCEPAGGPLADGGPRGDGLLVDLLEGGILVVTPGAATPGDGAAHAGIATLLQPDGDVVTLLAGPAGAHGTAGLARHAAAVRRTTRVVRAAARRLRRRTRLAALGGPLLLGVGGAGAAVAFGRVPDLPSGPWLAASAALAGFLGAAAMLAPVVGLAVLRRGRARRVAAANRAWLQDHGLQTGTHGLSSRA
jgi:hypothetical protein